MMDDDEYIWQLCIQACVLAAMAAVVGYLLIMEDDMVVEEMDTDGLEISTSDHIDIARAIGNLSSSLDKVITTMRLLQNTIADRLGKVLFEMEGFNCQDVDKYHNYLCANRQKAETFLGKPLRIQRIYLEKFLKSQNTGSTHDGGGSSHTTQDGGGSSYVRMLQNTTADRLGKVLFGIEGFNSRDIDKYHNYLCADWQMAETFLGKPLDIQRIYLEEFLKSHNVGSIRDGGGSSHDN